MDGCALRSFKAMSEKGSVQLTAEPPELSGQLASLSRGQRLPERQLFPSAW